MKRFLITLTAFLTGISLMLNAQIPGKTFEQLQMTSAEIKTFAEETKPVHDDTSSLQMQECRETSRSDLQIRDLLLIMVRVTKIFVWFVGALLFFTVMIFIKEMSDYFHRCKRQKEKGAAAQAQTPQPSTCNKKRHRKNPDSGHRRGRYPAEYGNETDNHPKH